MIKHLRTGLLVAATAGTLGITSVVAVSANATTGTSFNGTTSVTNRDDSGTNSNGTTNNWAKDNFTRNAAITFHGLVVQTHCPGITAGHSCYSWTGTIKDTGNFTTVVGDAVPGRGSLNGGSAPLIGTAIVGSMSGKYNYKFYTDENASSASSANVPATVTGTPPGTGTGNWVEQFFAPGTVNFWDINQSTGGSEYLGTTGSWTYTAGFGKDAACPNLASQWVDGSPNWGTDASAGNILAPAAGNC
jgi:hypothetical protein